MKPIVVMISIDGMRPDGLQQADTPHIDRLIAEGAYTLKARSVMPSVTLPCHTSMMRGVDVPRHGITTNTFMPLARPVPSLFDVAHDNGCKVGSFYNWGELRDLANPWSADVDYMIQESHDPEGDWHVAEAVALHVARQPFDLVFVYLGYTDSMGHDHGWMGPEYIAAISNADRCVGHILDAVGRTKRDTVVWVGTDHGGHDRSHGTEMNEDMAIPWILSGAGIAKTEISAEVRLFDTAPTVAKILGIEAPREWDGRPIQEALL